MFLLLLMGLGAAGVKAQVRIGGDGAPNAAAVLDLNATDTTNYGTKGLALPRVSLSSNTAILAGTANLAGMLVYNTGGTLTNGIYYWKGNQWVRIDNTVTLQSWILILDSVFTAPALNALAWTRIAAPRLLLGDACHIADEHMLIAWSGPGRFTLGNMASITDNAHTSRVICFGFR